MELLLIALIFIPLALLYLWWATRDLRRLTPKDLGFYAYLEAASFEEVGDTLPGVPPDKLKAWIRDFREVEKDIDRLIGAGGIDKFSKTHLRSELRRRHSFLIGAGLDRAVAQVVAGKRRGSK